MSLHPPHHLTCKVMADRAGQKIAASFDGTYRYMDIGGKGWTLLDGGPLTSYYSGTGSESEYSTSVINCIFQFCKFESTETYVSYFTAYKDLPVLLLGLDPFIPDIVGSDRARAIVNASLLVWPGTHNVLCWPHVYLYIKGSKFAKYMSSACTAELRESIEGDIISLHEARNQVEFDYVFETMRVVWTKAGEAGFAAYFKRHYATGVWARWWYGASITPGVKANQNSVESEHSAQKKLLGAALMKPPPLVTMNTSAPVMLAAAGKSNAESHTWPSTLAVKPRLSATVAAKARNLLNFKSIKVTSFVHSTCHPTIQTASPRFTQAPAIDANTYKREPSSHVLRTLNYLTTPQSSQVTAPPATGWPTKDGVPAILVAYVNAYDCKLEEVTAERVGAYEKLLNGVSPFTGGPTHTKLERA